MKKRVFVDLIVIFLIGFLPILWFPGQTMLFGHDAGFPFDPVHHFIDRLSVWSQRLGIGTDQSAGLLGALPIHGLQAFLVWIGLSFKNAQLLNFIFWFTIPGLTMYFFAYKISGKKYLPIFASIIYMVNFYLLQAWFVSEQTKFSIYAAFPLVAYFTYSYFTKKMGLLKTVLGTGITLGILNGGGSFPLYGGLIIFLGLLAIYFNFIEANIQTIRRTLALFTGTGVLFVLLSAYWFFPYIYYVLGFYSRDLALAGGAEGSLAWATYLSKGTTFINLFRGQGVPEWYINNFHAYASYYLTNPILIALSFLFPILAYLSLFIVKDKKEKILIFFFALLSLITLIFSGGMGTQLAIIFELFTRYLPGFAIFRSYYYKFDYSFYFAFAILIGFTLDFLLSKLEKTDIPFKLNSKTLIPILVIVMVFGYIIYHFPFLNGSFMDYSHEPGKELTTRITVPKYVFDFGKWSNTQSITKRYLVVPELSDTGFVAFKWRYWSIAPISSLQTSTSFVQNTLLISQNERFLMKKIYESLLRGDIGEFKDFADVFAIDGILVQNDFDWQNKYWGTTNPTKYENILNHNPEFKLIKTFGEWKVYDIVKKGNSVRITATPRLSFLHGELQNIVSFPKFNSKNPLFMDNPGARDSAYFINEATDVFLSPDCISCDLTPIDINFKYYNPKILPGSFLYPLVKFRESLVKKQAKDFNSLLNFLLTVSDRRIIEAKWMIDSKTRINFLEKALLNYHSALSELNQFVSKSDWGISSKEENTAAQTIDAHLQQEANLVESMYDNNLNNLNTKHVLELAYDEVLKLHDMVQKRIWITPNTHEKRYLFDLPRLGTYDVYVKENTLADPSSLSKSSVLDGLTINMPKENKTLKVATSSGGWINFGKVDIKDRILKIALKDSTVTNLMDSYSPIFPEGPGVRVDNGIYTFTTDSRSKCIYFPITNLETINTQYIISFSYRDFTDKNDLGFIVEKPGVSIPKLSVKNSFLPNSRKWLSNNIVLPREKYVITPRTESLNIYFCNGFSPLKESVNDINTEAIVSGQDVIQVKDITVNKLSSPSIVLYQEKQNIKDNEFVSDFQKLSTVEYKIKVKPTSQPVTLVMRESYGKYWRACEEGRCFDFNDKNHFASATFENAWYFKNGIKGDIDLYYYPQRVYIIGMFITGGTFILLLLGGLWSKLIKKRR